MLKLLENVHNLLKDSLRTLSQLDIRFERGGLKIRLRVALPLAFATYVLLLFLLRQLG